MLISNSLLVPGIAKRDHSHTLTFIEVVQHLGYSVDFSRGSQTTSRAYDVITAAKLSRRALRQDFAGWSAHPRAHSRSHPLRIRLYTAKCRTGQFWFRQSLDSDSQNAGPLTHGSTGCPVLFERLASLRLYWSPLWTSKSDQRAMPCTTPILQHQTSQTRHLVFGPITCVLHVSDRRRPIQRYQNIR